MNIENGPELAARLQEPFDPKDVDFLPQGTLSEKDQGRVVAYVDARVVATRFDEIFGPLGWSFTYDTLIEDAAVRVVRGTITIGDCVKQDIGDGGPTEPSKSAVSDALKRTAVLLGVGRYLYTLGSTYVKGRPSGKSWVPADGEVARLRATLPRPANMQPPPAQAPQRTERPATVSGVQSPANPPATASAPRVVAPVTRGTKVVVGSEIESELVGQEIRRIRDSFSWTNAELLKVARAHVNPDLPKLQDATSEECQALLDVLREKDLAALPEYASIVARPVGAV